MSFTTSSDLTTTTTTTSTQQISNSASDTIAANAAIQAYIQTVLSTPDIDLSSIPFDENDDHVVSDLPAHQATARENANSYFEGLDSPNAAMVSTLSDIIGFSNTYKAYYDTLKSLADAGDWDDFKTGVNNLIDQISTKEDNCDTVINTISAFKELVETDESNLNGDNSIVSATLDGEDGIIANLQDEIGAYNKAVQTDILEIAGASVGEIAGGLMIVVGVFGEFESGGTSTALVVAGLACIAGGATVQGIAGKDIASKNKQIKSLTTELNADQAIATCLMQASANITNIVETMDTAVAALTNLQSGWSSLKGDLQQIVESLDNAEDMVDGQPIAVFIDAQLDAAKSDWDDAHDLAKSLQSNGTLEVQTTDDPTVNQVTSE